MNQEGGTARPVGRRAEAVLDRAGQNLGFFVVSTGQRIQHVATSFRKGPAQKEPSSPLSEGVSAPSSDAQALQAGQSAMGRAEQVVDNVGGALGILSSVVGLRMRRVGARMREEVEDMWAEAQSLRSQRERPREEARA